MDNRVKVVGRLDTVLRLLTLVEGELDGAFTLVDGARGASKLQSAKVDVGLVLSKVASARAWLVFEIEGEEG